MLENKDSQAYQEFRRRVEESLNRLDENNGAHLENYEMQNGDKFDGIVNQWGAILGYGRIEYSNGDSYEGRFWSDEYDGSGIFTLAPRDWSNTSRPAWSTGKAWTFDGTFDHGMAKEGIFRDGIQNGSKVTHMKIGNLIPMKSFWIQAKLCKDNDKLNDEDKKIMFLPKDLYHPSNGQLESTTTSPTQDTAEAVAPAETVAKKERTRLSDMKKLPEKKQISYLLQQLLLTYDPT